MISRRRMLGGLGAVAGVKLFSSCVAPREAVSERPCPAVVGKRIKWIVPNAAGGGYDTQSRFVVPLFEEMLGAKIVVENVSGAGGLVGAKAIMTARPDGLTLGILNISGLMAAALTGTREVPSPARDFATLGRISRSWHVWAVSGSSPFQTLDDLIAEAGRRALIFPITELGTASFVSSAISAALLGVDCEVVSGFSGARDVAMAVLRGEADCVCRNLDSILDLIDAGELRPLLQVSDNLVAQHPLLKDVPLLGGENGRAVRRAKSLGHDGAEAVEVSRALIGMIGAGRVVVAPRGLDEGLFRCLEQTLHRALTSREFRDVAGFPIDAAGADAVFADLEAAERRAGLLDPFLREAIEKSRN